MAEGKKRAAVKARKLNTQASKGARRRQRTGNGGNGTERRSDTRAYGNRTVTRTSGQGLSITIQVPPLRRPKLAAADKTGASPSFRQRLLQPILLLPAMLIIALVAVVGLPNSQSNGNQPAPQVSAAERTTPDFQPLIPSAEKASATRYDGKRNMVSYTTTFSGIRITVSQQGLPNNFKKDPAAVLKAADSINAKQRIDTIRGALFVASNEGGDQMAVFANEQVLLFIHAASKLDDVSWKAFIELLTAKSWSELI